MAPVPLGLLHPRHGIHAPTSGTPARTPGSVRRTATTDMLRPDGPDGPLVLVGRARDLVTGPGGAARTVAEARIRTTIDFVGGRVVESITADPVRPPLAALAGRSAAAGFRGAALAADPALPDEDGLLHLLVDDIPVATLVSGYAFGAAHPRRIAPAASMRANLVPDQCAGFARDATIMVELDRTGRVPLVTGPEAPALLTDDAQGWHALDPLPPHAMRRTRRIDVRPGPGDGTVVDVLFRDSHMRPDGVETVIHEYTVAMEVAAGVVVSCEATPRVLPWVECPAAALSARRLAGQPLTGLRRHVRETFGGTSTCTHLNDTLRSLEDVPALLSLVSGRNSP